MALLDAFQQNQLQIRPLSNVDKAVEAGKPKLPRLVSPRQLPRRKMNTEQGRTVLIHAIAHIEFTAINLALDAVYRFQQMPRQYYEDWLTVASEEVRHFKLLQQRLQELGCQYGDYDAHNGLWEAAEDSGSDPLLRMALVPRTFEARGLDVTPGMIAKLKSCGDDKTAAILQVIFDEEIGHVAKGNHWYHALCYERQLDPETTYVAMVKKHIRGQIKGPFLREPRLKAGFSHAEIDALERIFV